MKIELDIDPAQLSIGVLEILRGLSDKDKTDIGKSLIREWLSVHPKEEKEIHDKNILIEMMKSQNETEDVVKQSYRYKERTQKFVPVREKMIQTIIIEGVKIFQEIVSDRIKEDDNLTTVFDSAMEDVESNFPMYVNQAMVQWFAQHMGNVSSFVIDQQVNMLNTQDNVSRIMSHLQNQGHVL